MPRYKRAYRKGGTFFFTAVTYRLRHLAFEAQDIEDEISSSDTIYRLWAGLFRLESPVRHPRFSISMKAPRAIGRPVRAGFRKSAIPETR
jgi:hypothetical protein